MFGHQCIIQLSTDGSVYSLDGKALKSLSIDSNVESIYLGE